MPTKMLPQQADINHLKHQAKDLLQSFRSERLDAFQRIREFHPKRHGQSDDEINQQLFTLGDAQLSIAREYGFKTWSTLKVAVTKQMGAELVTAQHERIADPIFKQAVDLLDEGNVALLRKLLSDNPQLINQHEIFEGGNYFSKPTLLEFIAENPILITSLCNKHSCTTHASDLTIYQFAIMSVFIMDSPSFRNCTLKLQSI